jgi:methyl-accepting chemotaxis protein
LLQSLAQQVAADGSAPASLKRIIDLPAYTGNFQLSYFGGADGVMFSVPTGNRCRLRPARRGWYKAANSAQQTIVTEPYIAASANW